MGSCKQIWPTPKLYGVGHFTEFNLYKEALALAKSKGFIDQAPVKMLKNVRKAPTTIINGESKMACDAVSKNEHSRIHHYKVEVRTELGEKEIVNVTAVDKQDAEDLALAQVMKGGVGLKGKICTYNVVVDEEGHGCQTVGDSIVFEEIRNHNGISVTCK